MKDMSRSSKNATTKKKTEEEKKFKFLQTIDDVCLFLLKYEFLNIILTSILPHCLVYTRKSWHEMAQQNFNK